MNKTSRLITPRLSITDPRLLLVSVKAHVRGKQRGNSSQRTKRGLATGPGMRIERLIRWKVKF